MNSITINELAVETIIGAFDWERQVTQKLLIDLKYELPAEALEANDDLEKVIDYGKICEQITEFVSSHHHKLLETLAKNLADHLESHCKLTHFTLNIHKAACIKNAKKISISLTR